jgi:hypothetical protein
MIPSRSKRGLKFKNRERTSRKLPRMGNAAIGDEKLQPLLRSPRLDATQSDINYVFTRIVGIEDRNVKGL